MTWTNPKTWSVGELVTAANMNTHLRDNMNVMDRGVLGVHSIGTGGGFGERYYPMTPIHPESTTALLSASTITLYAVPLFAPRFGAIDRIAYEVTTAGGAGGVGRQGIYAATSDTNPYPSALVVDGGEHVVTSTGMKISTVNVTLEPDILYWGVVLFGTNAPTVRTTPATQTLWSPIGLDLATSTTVWDTMFSRSQSYGALPSTFPASPPTAYQGAHVRMVMRFSA